MLRTAKILQWPDTEEADLVQERLMTLWLRAMDEYVRSRKASDGLVRRVEEVRRGLAGLRCYVDPKREEGALLFVDGAVFPKDGGTARLGRKTRETMGFWRRMVLDFDPLTFDL